MKSIMESQEVFETYAKIDLAYYGLKMLNEEMNKPQTPFEKAIDNSTGSGSDRVKKWKEDSIELLNQIIEGKKIIGADFSGDKETLKRVINI